MSNPRVYADFHNADVQGRVRLNCIGTTQDLARQQIQLREGITLSLYADDADEHGQPGELQAAGVVEYSQEEHCWVAKIDWSAIKHIAETANGAGVAHAIRQEETA